MTRTEAVHWRKRVGWRASLPNHLATVAGTAMAAIASLHRRTSSCGPKVGISLQLWFGEV